MVRRPVAGNVALCTLETRQLNSPRCHPRTFFAVLLLTVMAATNAVQVDVSINPDPPIAGESFRIAFEAKGEIDKDPDFSPLRERFQILSQNRQTAIQWMNGKLTRATTFVLEVLPIPGAELEIPAISFGDTASLPTPVPAGKKSPQESEDDGLILEVEAEPKNPYVQQKVTYTIRLWRRYELSNASLSEPKLASDGMVKSLGADRQFEASRGGKRYAVVERKFAIFPQTSGKTVIQPVTVTGQILERQSALFEMFDRNVKTRRINSSEISLKVRPIPSAFPPHTAWLPATAVRLSETWGPAGLHAQPGDPITQTVRLSVSGLTSGQLPQILDTAGEKKLRIYPDQPQLQDDKTDSDVRSYRQEKRALIGSVEGDVQIAAIDMPWWNLTTDSLEHAQLPAHVLHIEAPPSHGQTGSAPQQALDVQPSAKALEEKTIAPIELAPAGESTIRNWRTWPGWLFVSIFCAIGWLSSILWITRRTTKPARDNRIVNSNQRPKTEQALSADVLRACQQSDPRVLRDTLLAWAKLAWSEDPPRTLGALAHRTNGSLNVEISDLETALYSHRESHWNGLKLADAFSSFSARPKIGSLTSGSLPKIFSVSG